jgi:hypothetical protein
MSLFFSEANDKWLNGLIESYNKSKLENKEKEEPCIICVSDHCDFGSKPVLLYFDVSKMPFTIDELISVLWGFEFMDSKNDLHVKWAKYFYTSEPRLGQIYADTAGLKPTQPLPFKVSYIFQIDSANF